MGTDRYAGDRDVLLSMSPLIDCVFLLLIFFLVTTMLKRDRREVEHLNLPVSASSLELPPEEDVFAIAVDADAVIYVEGEESSRMGLLEALKELEMHDPNRRVRLDTDENTPFYRVVEVLDALSFRNITNVGIRTYHEKYD
jgi:biopolymer transport protein ExbD